MNRKPRPRHFMWIQALAILSLAASSAEPIKVSDQNGRVIEIELVSVSGDSVSFRRVGSSKDYSLPIGSFAKDSQDLIRSHARNLPAVMPKIDANVSIGKRRQKGDSSYMVKQEISATVKLTNSNLTTPVPPITGKLVFIGQDRRSPDLLNILSSQSVEASIEPGKTFEKEMESFVTTYDSDNKGSGNVGGSQYVGYILVMLDEGGNVVVDQTTSGPFRKAISNKPGILKEIISHPERKLLTTDLEPAPIAGNAIPIK